MPKQKENNNKREEKKGKIYLGLKLTSNKWYKLKIKGQTHKSETKWRNIKVK